VSRRSSRRGCDRAVHVQRAPRRAHRTSAAAGAHPYCADSLRRRGLPARLASRLARGLLRGRSLLRRLLLRSATAATSGRRLRCRLACCLLRTAPPATTLLGGPASGRRLRAFRCGTARALGTLRLERTEQRTAATG